MNTMKRRIQNLKVHGICGGEHSDFGNQNMMKLLLGNV